MPAHAFRNLKVWNDAMALVEDVYRATDGFPRVLGAVVGESS
jgi:hypothetical protein